MENLSSNTQSLFTDLIERALEEGIADREGFNQLASDLIEAHRTVGELHDDQNLEAYEDILEARWREYEEELAKRV